MRTYIVVIDAHYYLAWWNVDKLRNTTRGRWTALSTGEGGFQGTYLVCTHQTPEELANSMEAVFPFQEERGCLILPVEIGEVLGSNWRGSEVKARLREAGK